MSVASSANNGFAAPPLLDNPGAEHVTMFKFTLYETASRFFLVGADVLDQRFRVLKIDRTAGSELGLSEDGTVYSRTELDELITTLNEGNKSSGGLRLRLTCWGLLGFVRFTGDYYMLVVTARERVAMLGGHYVYEVRGTELISLTSSSSKVRSDPAHPEEGRFLSIFHLLDLNKSFYFSYSYDITNTLQHNLACERQALATGKTLRPETKYNDMFVWNHHLLEPVVRNLGSVYEWCVPLIHGFVYQSKLDIFGRMVYLTLIARRSRFFAGARFLKRGANDLGYVANDVETEQIVADVQTTPFHGPSASPFANSRYSSYVQHRGSIPLHWSQDNSGVTPKPDIDLNLVDPFYTAAALHFNNLFDRYGAPIYALNLVKSRERTPRESKLLREYTAAIEYLNQFLPAGKKIVYKAWDMSRASKTNQNVIQNLESIAAGILSTTGFFRNGNDPEAGLRVQNGVARTNCIDCLDRTNAAQSVIGKVALGYQLHALGVIETPQIEYDSDAVNMCTFMYHSHGDTIAVQYGGSHLVNTMETYRKTNQWSSQSRDMVESLKRYVNNSFLDAQRQEAYNLFLGNYIFAQGQPMLWELPSDYYLHHSDPRRWAANRGRNYINWYNSDLLEDRAERMVPLPKLSSPDIGEAERRDAYWAEYYRPLALSSLEKAFCTLKLKSTHEVVPYVSAKDGVDPSPFKIRSVGDDQGGEERPPIKKNITIIEPAKEGSQAGKASRLAQKESQYAREPLKPLAAMARAEDDDRKERTAITQFALNQLVKGSLRPSIKSADLEEYTQYVAHPLNLTINAQGEETTSPQAFEYSNFIQTPSLFDDPEVLHLLEEDLETYGEYLLVDDEPLTVRDDDLPKKRYTAYRKWLLKGKSLFKQSRLDPEVTANMT